MNACMTIARFASDDPRYYLRHWGTDPRPYGPRQKTLNFTLSHLFTLMNCRQTMLFRVFFRRKKGKRTAPPATRLSPQATAEARNEEEGGQNDPPPYSPPPTSPTDDAIVPSQSTQRGLLDPSLPLTAAEMEQRWLEKDRLFARAVVQFIAERFDGNLRGWAGYKYTYINTVLIRLPRYFHLLFGIWQRD